MTSILRRFLKMEQTGNKAVDGFQTGFAVTHTLTKGDEIPAVSIGTAYQYRLRAEIGITFIASAPELEHAKKVAWDRIAMVLYGPLHTKLSEVASAVSDGDRGACYRLLDEMREMMRG